jgi:drug/metabolite transporter (DMT)-like permease
MAGGVLALSLSSIFVRWAQAPGPVTSFYRMFFASLIVFPFFWRKVTSNPVEKIDWRLMLFPVLSGLFTALDHGVWSTAVGMTRVANATLLNNIAPLWVALVTYLFWKQRLTGRFLFGLVLTLGGAGIVFGNDLLTNPHLGQGDLIAIISSLFYAGYFLVTQRGREHFQSLPYFWMVSLFCGAFLLIGNLVLGNSLTNYSRETFLVFISAALISQIIGSFSIVYALGHIPAAMVAPTMLLQPVLTALLGIPLAGEGLHPAQWVGGLIVLVGIYLINRSQ